MMASSPITQLLHDWRSGVHGAEAQLLKLVYPAMKEIAGRQLRQANQFTLRPTELANDVCMQMRDGAGLDAANTKHFYALAARMIRFLIVDHIRANQAQKRGAEVTFVELEFAVGESDGMDPSAKLDWLALDAALVELEVEQKRYATLVELRYFMGMSIRQAADAMEVSTATAERIWRYARAFLADRLGGSANVLPTLG
jgi:RNA polymerase sigma factor (TIGR02999 family)